MRSSIDTLLARTGGAASRDQLLSVVSRNQLDDEVARGHLVAPFPRAYCRPWDVDQEAVRQHAALASVGRPVALSHLTALRRYGLLRSEPDQVHVTVPAGRHPIGRAPGLVVHRTRAPARVTSVESRLTVEPALAVARSWPMVDRDRRRAPAIEAVRRRLVTPADLRRVTQHCVGMPGRADLASLIDLMEAGCESELEIWGHLHVFDVPGLDHGVRQKWVQVRGRWYRLDLAYEEEQVAVELDGRAFHASPDQWERDIRRDAALAGVGWQTLRFSHRRLHVEREACRRESLAVLAARRAWRRSG